MYTRWLLLPTTARLENLRQAEHITLGKDMVREPYHFASVQGVIGHTGSATATTTWPGTGMHCQMMEDSRQRLKESCMVKGIPVT